ACRADLATYPWCSAPNNPLEGLPMTVSNAQLKLYVFSTGDPAQTRIGMSLGLPTIPWDESWANQLPPPRQNFSSFQQPGTIYSFLQAPPGDGWYSIDISTLYGAWLSPPQSSNNPKNAGIALCPLGTSNNFNFFRSADYVDPALGTTLRPSLQITYDDPAPLDIRMPLPGGMSWLLTTEIGGRDCKYNVLDYDKWVAAGRIEEFRGSE